MTFISTQIDRSTPELLAYAKDHPHILDVDAFANRHFQFAGKTRKGSNEPYIHHPRRVAEALLWSGYGGIDFDDMIVAALLHDTVEDTPVTSEEVHEMFGSTVGELVDWVTNVSTPEDGDRAQRKALDAAHTARAPAAAQNIKVADIIDNCSNIRLVDPRFAIETYLPEKRAQLSLLTKADPSLLRKARKVTERNFYEVAHAEFLSSYNAAGVTQAEYVRAEALVFRLARLVAVDR